MRIIRSRLVIHQSSMIEFNQNTFHLRKKKETKVPLPKNKRTQRKKMYIHRSGFSVKV